MTNYNVSGLKGICSVLVTPLNEDENLDKAGFAEIIQYQRRKQIDSILINGASSEGPSLSQRTRLEALDVAMNQFEGPIIYGVFESGTKKAVEEIALVKSRFSDHLGDVFFMVTPPIYFASGHSPEEITDHYKAITNLGVPIIFYRNTEFTGAKFTPKQIAELSWQENIVGMKFNEDSITGLSEIRREAKPGFRIGFAGRGPLVECLDVGADLLINTAAGVFPGLFSEFKSAYERKDMELMNRITADIDAIYKMYEIGPSAIAVAKTALSIITGCEANMTKPFRKTSLEQRAEIEQFLRERRLI